MIKKDQIVGLLEKDKALVVFCLPNEKQLKIIQGSYLKIDFNDIQESGFVFRPFEKSQASILIQSNEVDEFDISGKLFSAEKYLKKESYTNTSRDHYLKLVKKSSDQIKKRHLKKVVPSRSFSVKIENSFDPFIFFEKINDLYKSCFNYLCIIPGETIWIGASPELLLNADKSSFQTTSLAGTIKDVEKQNWTDKELEEQSIVTDFISQELGKLAYKNIEILGPNTVYTGNLYHLKTNFNVSWTDYNFNEIIKIANALHPTPATAGLPRAKALEFLLANESYKRELYSGFFGLLNIDSKSKLYVNLRCMKLTKNNAVLYAGAGVTSDSIPQKEYLETESKLQTLLNYLDA